ncbi:MAG TPA: hypothetical protein DCY62_08885, partial [Thalassospira sp.]|nr:hypothetical protein [Thalassospira sp.]
MISAVSIILLICGLSFCADFCALQINHAAPVCAGLIFRDAIALMAAIGSADPECIEMLLTGDVVLDKYGTGIH